MCTHRIVQWSISFKNSLTKNEQVEESSCKTVTHLGWKESSLTMHCFFSGTCFQVAGSARSTRALALRRPKPKRLLTISPAPFLFQPGLLAKGSNSEVQTTMCCRSLQVRSGLRERRTDREADIYWSVKWRKTQFWIALKKYHMLIVSNGCFICSILLRHTFVPVPRQRFQPLEEQRLTFQCESECTHCGDQH